MSDFLVSLGMLIFFVCMLILLLGFIVLIVSMLSKDEKTSETQASVATKMLLIGAIGAVVGFGICAANFDLYGMH